jgi:hypothetical protein
VVIARAYTNLAAKIAKIHQRRTDIAIIRRRIERSGFLEERSVQAPTKNVGKSTTSIEYPALGSPERKIHILKFQITHRSEPAFRNFSKDLYQFLTYLVHGPEAHGDLNSVRALDDNGMVRACFLRWMYSAHDL